MAEDDIKKRKQVRLLVKKEVVINDAVKGYALDISEGGMFIYTHIPFPKDKLLDLSFRLAEGDIPMNVQGTVRLVQEGVGVGVVFSNISQVNGEKIKRFIEENLDAHPLGLEAAALDARKKILIVDDSATARTIYKNKLALMGFVIREASGGTEAIKALGKERLDLIILDMQMEDMDGVKLLQLLRTNEEWKQIKVIVLSGRLTPQDAERVSAFSVSDILPKMTTTPNKLAERAKQILEE